eukprot:TRINITY_DN25207_c0_g1_i1.p1 TRINITY_DN25207_c0_g1~~TRINITY_DN25207_c0_g1_i1.p1  ORF type:complete len:423 (+),score=71.79 TRINITY_DN25207_c0_g1_i1:127-1269(+)
MPTPMRRVPQEIGSGVDSSLQEGFAGTLPESSAARSVSIGGAAVEARAAPAPSTGTTRQLGAALSSSSQAPGFAARGVNVPAPPPPTLPDSGCYRLRHIDITELMEDGTLGLLLHGTSVVSFCCERAESVGWYVGDQIVQVNGVHVGCFDEFLESFLRAQQKGFPIRFSVLRRESFDESDDGVESALERYLSGPSGNLLAGQLQERLVMSGSEATAGSRDRPDGQSATMENPYIQALQQRRQELLRSAEGWATEVNDSLASRLATQRCDALATLFANQPSPRASRMTGLGSLAPSWFFCAQSQCHTEACQVDIHSTPRIEGPWQPQHRLRSTSIHDEGAYGKESWGPGLAPAVAAADEAAGATCGGQDTKNFASQFMRGR